MAMAMIVMDADAAGSSSVPPSSPTLDHEHDEGLVLAVLADQQSIEVDESDDPKSEVDYVPPLREEGLTLAIIIGQQPMAADECGDPESEVDFVPLRIVRPEDEQPKRRSGRVKVCAHKPKTKKVKRRRPAYSRSDKTDKDDNFAPMGKRGRPTRAKSAKSKTRRNPEFVYGDNINISSSSSESESKGNTMRKRGRPARAKSAKSKIWRNLEFVYRDNINISSSSESESKGNKDADYNLTRKRGRTAHAKSAKSNMWHKPEFVYGDNLNISSSGSETKGNKDDDYNPMAPDADGHPKKYARSWGRPTRARSARSKTWHKPEFVSSDNINISSSSGSEMEGNKDDYDPTATDADSHRKKYASGPASERALEVMKKLPGKEASFVKIMQPSHVDRVFWLGLPRKFCKEHLPEKDTLMTLTDEKGQTYHAKYLVARDGLSGGWKFFAEKHRLKVGDALVFQLMSSESLQVYIVRESELTTTDDDVNSKEDDDVKCNEEDAECNDDDNGLTLVEKIRLRDLASKMATVKDALKAANEEVGELESSVKKAAQAVRQMETTPW